MNVRVFLSGAGLAMIVAAALNRPISILGFVRVPVASTGERAFLICAGAGLIVGCVLLEITLGTGINPLADLGGAVIGCVLGFAVSVAFQWVSIGSPVPAPLSGHWIGTLDYVQLGTSHEFELYFPGAHPGRLTVSLRQGGLCVYALTTRAETPAFDMHTTKGTHDCRLGLGVLRATPAGIGGLRITIDDGAVLASGTAVRKVTSGAAAS